ncbi:MAG: hypothetical protein VCA35_05950, partial [Roseibacillus sp.]
MPPAARAEFERKVIPHALRELARHSFQDFRATVWHALCQGQFRPWMEPEIFLSLTPEQRPLPPPGTDARI